MTNPKQPTEARHTLSLSERTSDTDDQRIRDVTPLPPPEHLIRFFPIAGTPVETLIGATRGAVRNILAGSDDRLLVVIGPCSIHDPAAALEYARKLKLERDKYADTLEIVMRVYFEKPRTTVGWKGLINDPYLDQTFQINDGLRMARHLLLDLVDMGVPAGTEFLDIITPQYVADLVSWGAIGARTTESQVHRQLVSGLSCPVGFKNGTSGDVQIAIEAMLSARHPHTFLGHSKYGQSAIFVTNGNPDTHVILRGGSKTVNYTAEAVEEVCAKLEKCKRKPQVMIDCSHANSQKDYTRQGAVCRNVVAQIANGESRILGLMIESSLVAGSQPLVEGKPLTYGQSITDPCIGWDETFGLLR